MVTRTHYCNQPADFSGSSESTDRRWNGDEKGEVERVIMRVIVISSVPLAPACLTDPQMYFIKSEPAVVKEKREKMTGPAYIRLFKLHKPASVSDPVMIKSSWDNFLTSFTQDK